jgi:thiol-disulfide isomerase/thioredoxin
MTKLAINCTILLTLLAVYCNGQSLRLGIGDSLPALQFGNVVNYEDKVIDFSRFAGKAVVLDFGSTSCPPCIESLAHFEELKEEFGEQMIVISVMKDKKERVQRFLQSNSIGKRSTIPILYEDSVLNEFFPHITQPHLVWIGDDGMVKAITNHHYIQKEYIRNLLNGDALNWSIKWDFPFDYALPLRVMHEQNFRDEMKPAADQSIYLSNHMPGVDNRQVITRDSLSGQVRVLVMNFSIPKMYLTLLGRKWEAGFMASQLVFNGIDSDDLVYQQKMHGPKMEWDAKNTYCYEMFFPLTLPESERNKRIIRLLNDYLSIDVELKTIERTCWIIQASSPSKVASAESGLTIKELINALNNKPGHPPVYYEKNQILADRDYTVRMDIDRRRLEDVEYVKEKLKLYGYDLYLNSRPVECLLIEKK